MYVLLSPSLMLDLNNKRLTVDSEQKRSQYPGYFSVATGRDLADYRQTALDTCLKLGLFPIVMEHFEAMVVGATEGSKLKLETADVYVGSFAHRYSYIENQSDGRSVTEIEFD
jgi:hypothetical protein